MNGTLNLFWLWILDVVLRVRTRREVLVCLDMSLESRLWFACRTVLYLLIWPSGLIGTLCFDLHSKTWRISYRNTAVSNSAPLSVQYWMALVLCVDINILAVIQHVVFVCCVVFTVLTMCKHCLCCLPVSIQLSRWCIVSTRLNLFVRLIAHHSKFFVPQRW